MSGHSKWSTIKRKKAATDAKRGKIFTRLLREVTVAARMGGGDVSANHRLRAAVAEARTSNVPNDNIDRAIKKGTGELEGGAIDELSYEGYGPGGFAILVETMTDNKNRTVSEIRHLFAKSGGNLGENGCVAWMFDRRGYFAIESGAMDEEAFMELALELGAEDLTVEGEVFEMYTSPDDYGRVLEEFEKRSIRLVSKELAMVPQNYTAVSPEEVDRAIKLVEALEDQDDVQNVWANLALSDETVAAS